jgi:hypothetical protein
MRQHKKQGAITKITVKIRKIPDNTHHRHNGYLHYQYNR